MELYTSLVRLKQSMNGGQLPPMTPVTGKALEVVSPEFTIGMGALREDPEKGLQCPVCGVFRRTLRRHLDSAHENLGGGDGVLRALSIPTTVGLACTAVSEKHSRSNIARREELANYGRIAAKRHLPGHKRKAARSISRNARTVGVRNLRNRCEAQIRHAFIDMEHALGRAPSHSEASKLKGAGFADYVTKVYGSWNAAKAAFGMDQYRKRNAVMASRDAAIQSIAAYYSAHGCLPSLRQADNPDRTPLLLGARGIMKAFNTESWITAMTTAANLLGIPSGRYSEAAD